MQIVLGILLIIVIGVAVFYWNQFEEANEYILELEDRLDREKYNHEILEKKVYTATFEEPHLGSVKNLQNKIKTILENTTPSNIAK